MIFTRIHRLFVFATAITLVSPTNLLAQSMMGPGSSPTDPSRGLGRVLGSTAAFSANARTVTLDTPKSKAKTTEYGFALLGGKTRIEMDLSKMAKNKADADGMKSMGMDRLVIVNDPATKISLMIYPGLKSYCETRMSDGDAASGSDNPTRTQVGNESVDGHPCVKSKVTTTEPGGKVTESLVWEATDLNNFPIQTQVPTDGGGTSTTLFNDIQNTSPDATLFKAPADFTKYGSMQELIMGSMQKMMQSGSN